MTSIFYSWMTGRPNATNRGFVGDALQRAAKAIGADTTIDVALRVDKDTLGVPGAPDIATTIFEKIDKADIFVADLTFIENVDAETKRPTPNPNVLVELGYALKALGWERIIMVFNEAFGSPEALPFDLRGRRVTTFKQEEAAPEKATERKRLVPILEAAIRSILEHAEALPRGIWFGDLAKVLIHLLAELDTFTNYHGSLYGSSFEGWATALRELARHPHGQRQHELRKVAGICDEASGVFDQKIGYEMDPMVERVRTAAETLKRETIDVMPINDGTQEDALREVCRVATECGELVERMDKLIESSRIERLQEEASSLGDELLVLVELPLRLNADVLERLRAAVHALRHVRHIDLLIDGRASLNAITTPIREATSTLQELSSQVLSRSG